MARHTTKKLIAGVFALSCAFILASCDSVEALPNNYEDPIIQEVEGNEPIYQNEMSVIYDAIASGKSEKVVDEMLKIISTNKYGAYYGEGGLFEAAKEYALGNKEKMYEFVKAHKAYYHSDDSKIVSEGVNEDELAARRAIEFVMRIDEKINKHFYDEIKGDSYKNEDGIFEEEKLAYSYYSQLYTMGVEDITTANYFKGYTTHTLDEKDVSAFVHIDDTVDNGNYYRDYIERKILPEVYKDRLVEEYILANNYSVLGRSYGRKVNILKLNYEASNKTFADDLMRAYATKYVLNADASSPKFQESARYLENAWRGFEDLRLDTTADPNVPVLVSLTTDEEELLTLAGKTAVVNCNTNIPGLMAMTARKDTQLGNLLKDFNDAQKAEKTRFATDDEKAALNKFTDSGAHPKEDGFVAELLKLAQSDFLTDGWYVKNGGLSEMPSDLRDRLFNINVSNDLDNANYKYEEGKSYIKKLNGQFFVLPSKTEKEIVNPLNFVFSDTSSNSFYIAEVEEAPSTSKLNLDNAESGYVKDKATSPLKSETFAREISRVISTRDSYVTSAYTEEFKACEFIYHDDVIYEYFKTTYPDLF